MPNPASHAEHRHASVRMVFLAGVLVPLLMCALFGATLVRTRLLDRASSNELVGHVEHLSRLVDLRAAIADEETQSSMIVVAERYGLVELGWFDLEAGRADLDAARAVVDRLVADRTDAQREQLDALRRRLDAGELDYSTAVGGFAVVAAGLTQAWDEVQRALEEDANGRSQPADVRSRLRALRATIDAFGLSMPRARTTVELYLGTADQARALDMVGLNGRFWDAVDHARADSGRTGAAAWTRFVEDPGVERLEAYFHEAPEVGLGLLVPSDLGSSERWIQSLADGRVWANLLADAVQATAVDLAVVARSHADADVAAVRVALLVTAAVLIASLVAARAASVRLARPMRELEAATRRVADGTFDADAMAPRGPREVAAAIAAFNDMTATLGAVERHAVALADDLDDPVLDRPLPGRTGEALQVALDRLRASIEEAEQQRVLLEQLATHDPLTGLLNRRAAFEALDRDVERAVRSGTAVAAFFVDLDGLKTLNDVHGHAVGDEAIRATARALSATARRTDVIARLGGDEFLVAGPVATGPEGEAEARALGDRLLAAIGSATVSGGEQVLPLRASIGGAVSAPTDVDGGLLVQVADEALYAAKRKGRGRIAWATPLSAAPT